MDESSPIPTCIMIVNQVWVRVALLCRYRRMMDCSNCTGTLDACYLNKRPTVCLKKQKKKKKKKKEEEEEEDEEKKKKKKKKKKNERKKDRKKEV